MKQKFVIYDRSKKMFLNRIVTKGNVWVDFPKAEVLSDETIPLYDSEERVPVEIRWGLRKNGDWIREQGQIVFCTTRSAARGCVKAGIGETVRKYFVTISALNEKFPKKAVAPAPKPRIKKSFNLSNPNKIKFDKLPPEVQDTFRKRFEDVQTWSENENIWRKPKFDGPDGMFEDIYRINPKAHPIQKVEPTNNLQESLKNLILYWKDCKRVYEEYAAKKDGNEIHWITKAQSAEECAEELESAIANGWTRTTY